MPHSHVGVTAGLRNLSMSPSTRPSGAAAAPRLELPRQATTILVADPTWPTDARQESENDVAQFVILCKPGLPKFMVLLLNFHSEDKTRDPFFKFYLYP